MVVQNSVHHKKLGLLEGTTFKQQLVAASDRERDLHVHPKGRFNQLFEFVTQHFILRQLGVLCPLQKTAR
jgi:hypothetical protein